jgi:hypothetical protein
LAGCIITLSSNNKIPPLSALISFCAIACSGSAQYFNIGYHFGNLFGVGTIISSRGCVFAYQPIQTSPREHNRRVCHHPVLRQPGNFFGNSISFFFIALQKPPAVTAVIPNLSAYFFIQQRYHIWVDGM